MDSEYSHLENVFSKASAVYDQKIRANFINMMIREKELSTLLKYAGNSGSILEIGCGTGEESKNFLLRVGRPVDLTAIDISPRMIETARKKVNASCPGASFSGMVMKAADIGGMNGTFDIIYTFNGALNTEPSIERFMDGLRSIMRPGGYFIASLRNKVCLGEKFIYTLLRKSGKPEERRGLTQSVEVVSERVSARNYTVREFLDLVPKEFRMCEVAALGLLSPPYLAEKFRNIILKRVIVGTEGIFRGLPLLRNMGDQTLYVFRRAK